MARSDPRPDGELYVSESLYIHRAPTDDTLVALRGIQRALPANIEPSEKPALALVDTVTVKRMLRRAKGELPSDQTIQQAIWQRLDRDRMARKPTRARVVGAGALGARGQDLVLFVASEQAEKEREDAFQVLDGIFGEQVFRHDELVHIGLGTTRDGRRVHPDVLALAESLAPAYVNLRRPQPRPPRALGRAIRRLLPS